MVANQRFQPLSQLPVPMRWPLMNPIQGFGGQGVPYIMGKGDSLGVGQSCRSFRPRGCSAHTPASSYSPFSNTGFWETLKATCLLLFKV